MKSFYTYISRDVLGAFIEHVLPFDRGQNVQWEPRYQENSTKLHLRPHLKKFLIQVMFARGRIGMLIAILLHILTSVNRFDTKQIAKYP